MPTTLIAAAAITGLGMQAYGMSKSNAAAKQMAAAQQEQIGLQQQVEAQRQKAMELEARRKQLELVRSAQKARAMSLTVAAGQGSGSIFGGSALQGAYGQTSGEANTYGTAISQNLQIGRDIAGLNQGISSAKIAYAGAQGDAATGAALSSLGGSIVSSAGTIGKIGAVGQQFARTGSFFGAKA